MPCSSAAPAPPTSPDERLAALRPCDTAPQAGATLFLAAMPGRYSGLDRFLREIADRRIDRIICLAEAPELQTLSPRYLELIRAGAFAERLAWHPVPDRSVPPDTEAFATLVDRTARDLRDGRNALVHCAAGIGRSGLFAAALLAALGFSRPAAMQRVSAAGGRPESDEQTAFLNEI